MQTSPMPLDAMAARGEALAAFRLAAPAEVAATLRQLQEGNVAVNLNAPGGSVYSTTVWAADAARGVLSFAADARDPQLQALLADDEAVAVAYLENVKVQFDLDNLVLVHGIRASALNATYPRELYRFQRRNSYRVRPILREAPVARLRHPQHPETKLALRVLDLSIGGCALLLPDDAPPLAPGAVLERVRMELDLNSRFEATLRLQHVTAIEPASRGVRLGCEMLRLGGDAERTLQRYIDQTQKRRRFMALD